MNFNKWIAKYESQQPESILGFQGNYLWLSNFWPAPVTFEGILYPSTEHAYQAAKVDPKDKDSQSIREYIKTLTPGQAKRYSRKVNLRPDWDK